MKLLMVTRESLADKRYGLGKSLVPLIAALERRGVTVGYLCQADASASRLASLQGLHRWLVRLLGRFFKDTDFAILSWCVLERINMGRLAAEVAAREGYTHVHCHDPILAAGLRWYARLQPAPRSRWGVTEHGFGCFAAAFPAEKVRVGPWVMRWLRRWEARTLLKADWVLTPTRLGLRQLAQDLSVNPLPPTWHAVPHSAPELAICSRAGARHKMGWDAAGLYVLSVGRLVSLKQFPALVRALAALPVPAWTLVLVGEGNRAPLQALAAELGVADRLVLATSDDMGLYYSAADLYVSTSLTESFGLATLEALSAGLPVVCTAVGGVPEVVGDGAWLIPAQDPRALTHALQTLLADPGERVRWAERARRRVQGWPTADQMAETYHAIYAGEPGRAGAEQQPPASAAAAAESTPGVNL